MSDTPPTPKKRRFAWGKVVLFASLALNLLIVGLIAGALIGGPRGHGRGPAMRDLGFAPFVQALPRSERRELVRAIGREAGSFRANRAELRRQFEAFLAALRAEPFDRTAIDRLIADHRVRVSERQALGQRLLLEQLEAMSAAERAAYADRLDNLLRRRGRSGDD